MKNYAKPQISHCHSAAEHLLTLSQQTSDTPVVDDGRELDARQTNLGQLPADDNIPARHNVWE